MPSVAGGPRDGGGGSVSTTTAAVAVSRAANLCPHAIFDEARGRSITGEGDPTLTATQ